ncbi:phospholipase D-like domain-containing protein [Coraliomargarita algicola]|uniref:Phospholipase D-like domain-containing protein n=1 Tax=Coraliomargarita algicola TaxID=3092156 RepID=A0ABZ0RRI7_9BACT|nr:phospholipase D-like domain-containing protein [Coraliomargarita sp. J2-16]WPJ97400.1 phospholipase D-like domain-containing protein [Coraliomargarita sp. J2-16]
MLLKQSKVRAGTILDSKINNFVALAAELAWNSTMWSWVNEQIVDPLIQLLGGSLVFVFTNFTAIIGFLLAALIIRRVFEEKRNPSNFFAWFFIVIFMPIIGVPLYFIFGGRKSRKLARNKLEVTSRALDIAQQTQQHKHTIQRTHSQGNHFELLPDGETAFKRLCHEIETAEHTIHIATYILGNDETGHAIVDRLAQRAQAGIKVRLLLDSLGSWNCTRAARYKIRRAGGEVAMFMPVLPIQTQTSSNLRNHRKIAIFDNYRAITGGQNIDIRFMGAEQTPGRFTDFSIVTQGPAVATFTRTFIADWAFSHKESPAVHEALLRYVPEEAGNSTTEIITSGPDAPNDPLWEQIVRIIQEFKQSLTIITPYFIPDEVVFRSLIVKAHTGRHIRLILPLKSNQRLTDIARYHYLRELDQAGIDIQFYTPRMMHGKLILADGIVAMTGSANIDMRSLFVNFEIGQLHYTPSDIAILTQWAESLEKDCISYREAIRDRKILPNRMLEDLVHLIAPML